MLYFCNFTSSGTCSLTHVWFSFAASAATSAGGGGGGHDFSLHDEKQLYSASAAAAAAAAAAVHSAVPDVASVLSPSQLVGSDKSIFQEIRSLWFLFGKDLDPNLVLLHESMIVSSKLEWTLIRCLTPSNVLPFYVTAETGSAECPGFAALSTLLEVKSKGISYNKLYKKIP